MKPYKDFFHRALDELNEIDEMLRQEGKPDAERRYLKIMAVIALRIHDSLLTLRSLLSMALGILIGLTLTLILK